MSYRFRPGQVGGAEQVVVTMIDYDDDDDDDALENPRQSSAEDGKE